MKYTDYARLGIVYPYNLIVEWDELSKEIKEKKIDDLIRRRWLEGQGFVKETNKEYYNLGDAREDLELRNKINKYLSSHFPLTV